MEYPAGQSQQDTVRHAQRLTQSRVDEWANQGGDKQRNRQSIEQRPMQFSLFIARFSASRRLPWAVPIHSAATIFTACTPLALR